MGWALFSQFIPYCCFWGWICFGFTCLFYVLLKCSGSRFINPINCVPCLVCNCRPWLFHTPATFIIIQLCMQILFLRFSNLHSSEACYEFWDCVTSLWGAAGKITLHNMSPQCVLWWVGRFHLLALNTTGNQCREVWSYFWRRSGVACEYFTSIL